MLNSILKPCLLLNFIAATYEYLKLIRIYNEIKTPTHFSNNINRL